MILSQSYDTDILIYFSINDYIFNASKLFMKFNENISLKQIKYIFKWIDCLFLLEFYLNCR
jgi:hypothetical protein